MDVPADQGEDLTDDKLKDDIPRTTVPPENAEEIKHSSSARQAQAQAQLKEELARQAKQNTVWRQVLFWGILSLVIAVALTSLIGFIWYIKSAGRDADSAVISTWIGGSVVQVVGLLAIVTRHLFPKALDGETE